MDGPSGRAYMLVTLAGFLVPWAQLSAPEREIEAAVVSVLLGALITGVAMARGGMRWWAALLGSLIAVGVYGVVTWFAWAALPAMNEGGRWGGLWAFFAPLVDGMIAGNVVAWVRRRSGRSEA